jgi:hypothetical protein
MPASTLPITDLGIANLALIDLGQPTLAVADSTSKAGRLFLTSYEPTVLEMLRSHPWRCCRAQAQLASDPTAVPLFGYALAFRLPANFVRTVYVEGTNDGDVSNNIEPFARHGQYIHCNIEGFRFTYIARKPTDEFDPGLVATIAARLAWRWCKPFTDSANDVKMYQQAFAEISADAKFADAMDGSPDIMPLSTWEQARLSDV